MHVSDRLSDEQIAELAMKAVAKISLHGARGATLCSLDETIAMAALIVRLEPVINAAPMQTITVQPEGDI
mgnify:CR=1 FL=1